MQAPKMLTFVVFAFALCGCVNLAHNISKLSVGMTKEQVLGVLGVSTSANDNMEVLRYTLNETARQSPPYGVGVPMPYYVRMIGGRVESFGRMGDFDSTKTPTIRVESDEKIKQDVTVKFNGDRDMHTELKKLKDLKDNGVLTQQEFEQQKKRILEKY